MKDLRAFSYCFHRSKALPSDQRISDNKLINTIVEKHKSYG